MNYNAKLNLLRLKKAGVMSIQGRGEVLKCLVIPIEPNHLFVSADDNNRPKSVYLDLTAWEVRNPQFNDSHMIKQSLSKEVRQQITEQELRDMPILGNLSLFDTQAQNAASTVDAPFAQTENIEDLPF